ncbi:MAG: hypothetical protein H6745_22110 [Deltaproteobacteria bacterium]|nr:hypothetical protein [Deltaproteobacteria bacterium]
MRWRLLGVVPLVNASNADVTRSARQRAAAELVFCPAGQAGHVTYTETDDGWLRAEVALDGEQIPVDLAVDARGDVSALRMLRWGDPGDTGVFGYHRFGADLSEPRDVGGVVIPTRMEAGWFYGTPRFASDGAFFRARVTDVRPAPDLAW